MTLRSAAAALVYLTLAPGGASAQTTAPDAAANVRDFDFMVEKITANYAGFDSKVTEENRSELTTLTARLRAQASAASDEQMLALMSEWVGFFQDGHTRVFSTGVGGAQTDDAAPAQARSLEWNEDNIRHRLSALGRRRDPIEGIWRIGGDRYRVGVLRTGTAPSAFAAVVLTTTAENWSQGQVKADVTRGADGAFQVAYRMGDHEERHLTGVLLAENALFQLSDDVGVWTREWPAVRDPAAAARLFPSDELFLRRLSADTLWLRIPDFGDERALPLRATLNENADALRVTPNLIIDLRDNGGGGDYVYQPLLPLIYTRPIYSIGVEFRSSRDNIALRREILPLIVDAPDTVASLQAQIEVMEQNVGRYVQPDAQSFYINTLDEVLPAPVRVAVLIDGAASTGEQFLLDARQSRKVTLFGQRNSAGVLDFANVVGMESPSGRFMVRWATSRSLRLPSDPVDPEGIEPDIRIPADVADPVNYAREWLERQSN